MKRLGCCILMALACNIGSAAEVRKAGGQVPEVLLRRFTAVRVVPRDICEPGTATPADATRTYRLLHALFKQFTRDLIGEVQQFPKDQAIEITPTPKDIHFVTKFALVGPQITPELVNAEFNNLNRLPALGESVRVCFVSCHGNAEQLLFDNEAMYDTKTFPRRDMHQLMTSSSQIERQAFRPHLAVLIVDACDRGLLSGESQEPIEMEITSGIWKSLYFGHQGFVELVSCGPEEKAAIIDGKSLFLKAFVNIFQKSKYDRDVFNNDPKKLVEWSVFFDFLRAEYEIVFEEAIQSKFVGMSPETTDIRPKAPPSSLSRKDRQANQTYFEWKKKVKVIQDRFKRMSPTDISKELKDPNSGNADVFVELRKQGPPTPTINRRGANRLTEWEPNERN